MKKTPYIEEIIFKFLGQLTKNTAEKSTLTNIFQLVYQLVLILGFIITNNPAHQFSLIILQTPFLPLMTFTILAMVGTQIVVAFLCNFQYQLYHQLCLYRYIIFPLMLVFVIAQIQNPYYLFRTLAILIFCFVTIFTLLLSRVILEATNIDKLWNFEYFQVCFVLTDILMVLRRITESNAAIWTLLMFWATIEYILYRQSKCFYSDKNDFKLSSYISCLKQFFLCILIFLQIFLPYSNSFMIILVSGPAILIIFVLTWCRSKQVILKEQIFNGEAQLSYFINFARTINNELLKFKKNSSKSFKDSFLMVFISIHQNNCKNTSCPLLQPSTAQELKNSSQPTNTKILVQKIIKQIQILFNIYLQKNFDSSKLRLLLFHFYVTHLPNKQKILYLVRSVQNFSLSWDQKIIFLTLSGKVENIEEAENIDSARGQDQFEQFKSTLRATVGCLRQFWQQLLAEKVDLNQLMSISSKLFPLKKQVEQIWKKHLMEQKFTSWNILRTYVVYRRYILHDYTNSCILQDYCKIMQEKLKSKHQTGYINSETERGVITILLTESSLGNISSVNSQTCKIFGYSSRNEIVNLRVNDIMPSVISDIHDNILSTYLKNRYKQINQDQRLVFGKNKGGFIFPILLQLRKLSWNVNDELIFIGNFQVAKIKSAPIYCISDLEGNILDYTSSFANLFLTKNKNQPTIQTKNIQELIPSFFDILQNYNEVSQQKKFLFPQKGISKKINQLSQIYFSATEMIIKGQKVGYLVQGQQKYSVKRTCLQTKNPHIVAKNNSWKQIYRNSFNPSTFTYQISSSSEPFEKKININQFSIPFFQKQDLQQIFNVSEVQKIDYAKSIKTVRLNNNKFQRVLDQESFYSDQNNEEWRQKSVITRIRMMKQQKDVKDNKSLAYFYRVAVILISGFLCLFCFLIFLQVNNFEALELDQQKSLTFKWTIRQLVPEYLIYCYSSQNLKNDQLMQMISKQLSQNLISADIQEYKKSTILRMIYDREILDQLESILDFRYNSQLRQSNLIPLLLAVCFLELAFQIVVICMFLYYKYVIASIYLMLLSITDKKLHFIEEEANILIDTLSSNSLQKSNPLKSLHQFTNHEEQDDDNFQRIKKFKTNFKRQYLQLFSQLVLPILLLVVYLSLSATFININYKSYRQYSALWKQNSQLLAESSMVIMQSFLNYNHIVKFNISTASLYDTEQSFQRNLYMFDFDNNSQLEVLLKGNPCLQNQLPMQLNISQICQNQTTIFQNGLMSVLNFVTTVLNNYQLQLLNPQLKPAQVIEWPLLTSIQYDYIKPLLLKSGELMKASVDQYRFNLQKLIMILTSIAIGLMVLVLLYLYSYPIEAISERLMYTKDLINIVPADKQFLPKDALTNLTTEAFDQD